ncbi:MAG TPA: GNAT family N-acetyltransferase [Pyrinomonadaceae bacterium]|nr:GNAT family N-acetyltransferase [Pyrinomonadaceae bacterium]
MAYTIRKAKLDDRDRISELIADSARGLSREHYDDAQIEAAIASVFGVDTTLIEDGTYFVVEDEGELAGCGGWSRRKTLFGGDQYATRDVNYIDPETEPARIRAFFVHPAHARKGVAHAILKECEREATADGFRAIELMSTLPGVKFYEACGYSVQGTYILKLIGDVKLQLIPMRKEFEPS